MDDTPQYIKPEHQALFKALTPEDIQLPAWARVALSHANQDICRKAVLAVLTTTPAVTMTPRFEQELKDRQGLLFLARQDVLAALRHMAAQKAKPWDALVQVEPVRPARG